MKILQNGIYSKKSAYKKEDFIFGVVVCPECKNKFIAYKEDKKGIAHCDCGCIFTYKAKDIICVK